MAIEKNQLRLLPSVDELLQSSTGQRLTAQFSRPLVLTAIRDSIAQARAAILDGVPCPPANALLTTAERLLEEQHRPQLRSVINATGVIINTNLGRAPLSLDALQAIEQVARGYRS